MPDPAVLARLALRRLAEPGGDRTVQVARGRHRTARRRRSPVLVAFVALVLVVGVAVSTTGNRVADSGSVLAVAPAIAADPVTAAVRLTVARARALAAGDLGALRAVTVPGSSAARADLRAAARLGGGLPGSAPSPGHVRTVVRSAARLTTRCAGCAEVRLVAAATLIVSDPGPVEAEVAGGAVQPPEADAAAVPVVLVLRRLPAGWRVSEVRAP